MRIFWRIIKILLFLLILAGIYYQYEDVIRPRTEQAISKVFTGFNLFGNPCKKPIAYALGTFDIKFGIGEKYFLDAIKEAEAIWEEPFGRELFEYRAEYGEKERLLKVNLIYDFRQDATNKLSSLGIVVKENRASYDALANEYKTIEAEFVNAQSEYTLAVKAFNDRQKKYEEEVKYWNRRGGAPEPEYNKLQNEKAELDILVADLQTKQNKINALAEEVNALVVVLNRLAKTLNITVEKYNTIGASRGESFEEGVYTSDGLDKEIDIYEFSSREKLVRVLAHEFGHALGLEHVDDPSAIMYELNQGDSAVLSETDLKALQAKCGVEG